MEEKEEKKMNATDVKLGHNIVHLVYPLKKERNLISYQEKLQKCSKWSEIYTGSPQNKETENMNYIFPSECKLNVEYREWISNEEVYNYFHPSVQKTLFHKKKMYAFRRKKNGNAKFAAKFESLKKEEPDLPIVQFEWISTEIYDFSGSAVLVVRLSLNENIMLNNDGSRMKREKKNLLNLDHWLKFTNRIRQNYKKYKTQPYLLIKNMDTDEDFQKKKIYSFIEDMLRKDGLPFYLSHVELEEGENPTHTQNKYKYIEPNAYVHGYVSVDQAVSSSILYQACMIDDYSGESGGTSEFQQDFLASHVYRRWENYGTYFTALDYGAITVVPNSHVLYENEEGKGDSRDLMLQHHTRQYLLLIVLQLFYRDELQELMGRYSRLENIGDSKSIVDAKEILKDYYKLNQHFFFDRVSLEIQGLELWKFYQNTLGVKELYHAVQEDMRELNNRLIEVASEKQNTVTENLTVVAALTGMFGMNLIIPYFGEHAIDLHLPGFVLYGFNWVFHILIVLVIAVVIKVTVQSKLIRSIPKFFKNIIKKKNKI